MSHDAHDHDHPVGKKTKRHKRMSWFYTLCGAIVVACIGATVWSLTSNSKMSEDVKIASALCRIANPAPTWTAWKIAPSSAQPSERPVLHFPACAKVHFLQDPGKDFVYECQDADTDKWDGYLDKKGACYKVFSAIRAANLRNKPRIIKWRLVPI